MTFDKTNGRLEITFRNGAPTSEDLLDLTVLLGLLRAWEPDVCRCVTGINIEPTDNDKLLVAVRGWRNDLNHIASRLQWLIGHPVISEEGAIEQGWPLQLRKQARTELAYREAVKRLLERVGTFRVFGE